MSTNCSGLPYGYIELRKEPSGNEHFDMLSGSIEAKRVFFGPWIDRIRFVRGFLPDVKSVNGELIIYPATEYPEFPSLVAISAEIQGKLKASNEGADNQISFEMCEITITYSSRAFEQQWGGGSQNVPLEEQDFLVQSFDIETEILHVPANKVHWEGNVFHEGHGPFKKIIQLWNWKIKQLFVPRPRWKFYQLATGTVNDDFIFAPQPESTIKTLEQYNNLILQLQNLSQDLQNERLAETLIFDPETLLYNGPTGFRKITTFGIHAWEIEHSFVWNPNGWNEEINPNTGNFERVLNALNNPLYSAFNHNKIFSSRLPAQ